MELHIFNQIPPEQQVNNTARGPVWGSFKAESIVSIAIQVAVFNKEINISRRNNNSGPFLRNPGN